MFSFQGTSWISLRDSMKPHSFPLSLMLWNFSQSLFKKWWAKMDSNHRPHDYQSCALASWAIGPYLVEIKSTYYVLKLRFQNSTVALFLLSESNPLRWALLRSHFLWWRVPGSNRWPPACKAGALPAELTPHKGFLNCLGTSRSVPSKLNNVKF